ncbi:MAG: ATP-binding cassette domain-containing protein, partial [Pseudomonadota bacterium]
MASYQYIYVIKGLKKVYGSREVIKDLYLSFLPGAKIGIIGHNGSGKSTLLRIMAGIDKDFTGEAWPAEGVKVGYLEQEPQLDTSKNVFDNILDAVEEKRDLLANGNVIFIITTVR